MNTSEALIRTIAGAVEAALADPAVPVRSPAPTAAAAGIAERVEAEVAPLVAHAANAEPWYRSRVTWGALVSLASPLLGFIGLGLEPGEGEAIVTALAALVPALGAAVTLYGRWVARRPIGR